jgi:NAD(P)H-dependent flavin oxidoreductase YrpB (nitropropane dioxygenase family)
MDALPPIAPSAAVLDRLMARGAGFFGSRVAIMGGAMSWVSERHLVAALSNAGAFGVIACGAMEPNASPNASSSASLMAGHRWFHVSGAACTTMSSTYSQMRRVGSETRVPRCLRR